MEGRREWIVDFEAELGSLLKEYDIHMSTDTPSYDLSMRDLNIIHVDTACIGWAPIWWPSVRSSGHLFDGSSC